jgi:fibronectin type 3 domain-containing protein
MTTFKQPSVESAPVTNTLNPAARAACNSRKSGEFWRKKFLGIALLFATLIAPTVSFGVILPPSSVKLGWNASPDADVAGYRVYYGSSSRNYTNSVDVGNVLTNTVAGLINGTRYYFAVTAYDMIGLESPYSNEVNYTPGGALVKVSATSPSQVTLSATGPVGRSYDVLASTTLKTWTVIGSVTVGPSGTATFTDTNTGNYPARYYRLREK